MWRSEVAAIPIITNMMPADHPLFRCAEMPRAIARRAPIPEIPMP